MESLQQVLEIVNRVNDTASKVEINGHQCSRLAKVFDEVGKSIKLLIVANKDDGQESAEIDALDALLHVLESGELLVLGYAGPNWFQNLMLSQNNKEAFEEVYDDLRDIMDYMFGIPFDKLYYPLSDDAAQDQKEMAEKLYGIKSQQCIMVGTSTANSETSSELHIQSYSLDIALEKLNRGRAAPVEIVPLAIFGLPNYDEAKRKKMPDSVRFGVPTSHPHRRIKQSVITNEDIYASCRISFSRPSFKADDVGTRDEESELEAVDLRIEPSKIKLGEILGAGCYSEVRVAEWVDCQFAVKILRAPDVIALRNEVGIHIKLRHPHIVLLVGFSEDKDKCMILMELMEGDLHTHIASQMKGTSRKQPFSLHEAVGLMKQIALGMEFLHLKGVLHGDLKTQNVLLKRKCEGVELKIADFGVSKEKTLEGVYEDSGFSGIKGSGWYRAPEILESIILKTEAKYSGKADVYSFAMTAYEILTGLAPFQNKLPTRQSVVAGDRPELPPQLNLTLKQLVERCWHGDQDVRPSFKEICTDLKSLALSPEVDMQKRQRKIFFMRPKAKAKALLLDIMDHVYASFSNVNC